MLKKKICVLTIFFIMILCNMCSASDNKWVIIRQTSEEMASLDETRVFLSVDNEEKYLECYVKTDILKENVIVLEHIYIQVSNLSYKIEEATITYENDKYIEHRDMSNDSWKSPPPPEANLKTEIVNIIKWAHDNKDKIQCK